mmetsp:Transcript_11689/g.17855  ORF Transcript_11689/g.17855 Transcript_11689/m.17855 type:complete len:201 (+) Transcript_11689:142-744(+)
MIASTSTYEYMIMSDSVTGTRSVVARTSLRPVRAQVYSSADWKHTASFRMVERPDISSSATCAWSASTAGDSTSVCVSSARCVAIRFDADPWYSATRSGSVHRRRRTVSYPAGRTKSARCISDARRAHRSASEFPSRRRSQPPVRAQASPSVATSRYFFRTAIVARSVLSSAPWPRTSSSATYHQSRAACAPAHLRTRSS